MFVLLLMMFINDNIKNIKHVRFWFAVTNSWVSTWAHTYRYGCRKWGWKLVSTIVVQCLFTCTQNSKDYCSHYYICVLNVLLSLSILALVRFFRAQFWMFHRIKSSILKWNETKWTISWNVRVRTQSVRSMEKRKIVERVWGNVKGFVFFPSSIMLMILYK